MSTRPLKCPGRLLSATWVRWDLVSRRSGLSGSRRVFGGRGSPTRCAACGTPWFHLRRGLEETHRATAIAAAALMLGCPAAGTPPPGPEPPCPGDELLDDGGVCVPAACGVGPWGLEGSSADAVHIAPWGSPDGDGSAIAPLTRLDAALELALERGASSVLLTDGEYEAGVDLEEAHSGLSIRGRCAARVRLTDDRPEESVIAVLAGADVSLSGLTLAGAFYGLAVDAGSSSRATRADVRDLMVDSCVSGGVVVNRSGAVAELRDVTIRGCEYVPGLGAAGLVVSDGASATVRGLHVEGSDHVGVFVRDAELDAEDLRVVGVRAAGESSATGIAINASDGAQVRLLRTTLEAAANVGLVVTDEGTRVEAEDLRVSGGEPVEGVHQGGIVVQGGAGFVAQHVEVVGAPESGIYATHEGVLDLYDVSILDTVRGGSLGIGVGLHLQVGSQAVVRNLLIDGADTFGVYVLDDPTSLELSSATVRGVRRGRKDQGRGVQVHEGGRLVADDLWVEDCDTGGIIVESLGATAELERVTIRDTRSWDDEFGGECLSLLGDASVLATALELSQCTGNGVAISLGASAELRDTTVTDVRPYGTGEFGRGVTVQRGGSLVAEDLWVERVAEAGIVVQGDGAWAELARTTVRDVAWDGAGEFGRGLVVALDASATVTDLEITGVGEAGIVLIGPDAEIDLERAVVQDVVGMADGSFGTGLTAAMATVVARDLRIEDVGSAGLVVGEPGTRLEVTGLVLRRTSAAVDGSFGHGVQIWSGATAEISDAIIEDVISFGLLVGDADAVLDNLVVRGVSAGASSALGHGLTVQGGSVVEATGLVAEACEGPGIYATDEARVICTGCTIDGAGFAGLVALGGTIAMEGGSVLGSRFDEDLGGGVGAYAWDVVGASALELTGVGISGQPGPAVYLRGPGRYRLEALTLNGADSAPAAPALIAAEGVAPWSDVSEEGLLFESGSVVGWTDGLLLDASGALVGPLLFDVVGAAVRRQHCDDAPDLIFTDAVASTIDCEGAPVDIEPLVGFEPVSFTFIEVVE